MCKSISNESLTRVWKIRKKIPNHFEDKTVCPKGKKWVVFVPKINTWTFLKICLLGFSEITPDYRELKLRLDYIIGIKKWGRVTGFLRKIHILLKVLQKQKSNGINFNRAKAYFISHISRWLPFFLVVLALKLGLPLLLFTCF